MADQTVPSLRNTVRGCLLALSLFVPQLLNAVEPGDAAPDFVLPILVDPALSAPGRQWAAARESASAGLTRLSAFRGKVVYLDFWDSFCGPCRESLPMLAAIREQYARSDLAIVSINLDPDPRDALRFLDRFPVNYAVASDPSIAIAGVYGLQGLPTAFFIDRDGTVQEVHRGFGANDVGRIQQILNLMTAARAKG